MGFQLSPGVLVTETDLTTVVPAVATTAGGFVGQFVWGPAEERVLVDSENKLRELFGKPNDSNAAMWFTAANFLGYGNNLQVVRAIDAESALNASNATGILIKNADHYTTIDSATLSTGTREWAARYPGVIGNSIRISLCDNLDGVVSVTIPNGASIVLPSVGDRVYIDASNTDDLSGTTAYATVLAIDLSTDGDAYVMFVEDESGSVSNFNEFLAALADADGNRLFTDAGEGAVGLTLDFEEKSSATPGTAFEAWSYSNLFDSPPGTSDAAAAAGASNDEVHVVVIDQGGAFTGVPGTVLEVYPFLSKGSDAIAPAGGSNYYKTVLNRQSKYVFWCDHPADVTGWGSTIAAGTAFGTIGAAYHDFANGADGAEPSRVTAYQMFSNPDEVDVSLLLAGPANATLANTLIDIAEGRRDAIAVISPEFDDVVNTADALTNVLAFRATLTSSSYGVMDSGWKMQYDRYNDVNRWVPLNGDIAGLMVRTDEISDPWFSPAGYNRGVLRNVIRLAWNPSKAERDELYKKSVNPVISVPGQGTLLFGDKTMLLKPSAFDRINVRRLFIVLEKAISISSAYSLFEFNDSFTRAQFRNLIEPFLRDVQARRGIQDFRVVCDESNNTAEVIDRNEFVADIYIKPSRSINYIRLNFVATRSGVTFEEVGA